MAKIFISYKRNDKTLVMPIVNRITSELGDICWIDLNGIESNAVFETKIVKAIEESKIFLFMFSQSHNGIAIEDEFDDNLNLVRHQDWTIRELNLADNKYKMLVNLDGSSLDICPLVRGRFHSANYTNAQDSTQVDKLIDTLGKLLKINRSHAPSSNIPNKSIDSKSNNDSHQKPQTKNKHIDCGNDESKGPQKQKCGKKKLVINVAGQSFTMCPVKNKEGKNDYYMGETQVTQSLWSAIMNYNPSMFREDGENRPVERISLRDCKEFISKLNILTSMEFRIPTEEEWTFAAKGGLKGNNYIFSGGNYVDKVAKYEGNSPNKTCAVQLMEPNELELYDMSGNVWEWCEDGTVTVIKGGAYDSNAYMCKITSREKTDGIKKASNIGLRLAMTPK